MNKINIVLFSFGLLLVVSCQNKNKRMIQQEKPNVLVIFIDDMGFADPSCFGNPLVQTPNIDALAEAGRKFTNFYVNSPICSPSRVALNTGQYPMRHKIHSFLNTRQSHERRQMKDFLDPTAPTLARTLQANGYATGHFGKWHMGGGRDVEDAPLPEAYGFDQSIVSFEGLGNRVLWPEHGLSERSALLERGPIQWAPKHQTTQIYVDSTLAFIKSKRDQPFYVHFFPNDVHDPHLPETENVQEFATLSENPYEQKFFAVLTELDQQIGRLLDSLQTMDKLENTIIVFTSDNGPTDWPWYGLDERYPPDYRGPKYPPGFTGPYYGRKWSLYEGGIRMPFIISWPGHISANTTDSTTIVSAIDLFPSICSMLGLSAPNQLDGSDKSQAFLGTPQEVVPAIMWEYSSNPGGSIQPGTEAYRSPVLAVRDGDWKLLLNNDSTRLELYNLVNDPGEENNLVGQEVLRARDLAQQVLTWRRSMPVKMAQ